MSELNLVIPEECELLEDNKIVCEDKECVYDNEHGVICAVQAEAVDYNPHDKEKTDLFMGHVYLVVIAAILSLTLTQIIKPFIWKTCSEKSDAVIRLFAVLTGAGIAYTISKPFAMIDVYMGASAGAINAFVIKMFKAKVKKSLGVDETPVPEKDKSYES